MKNKIIFLLISVFLVLTANNSFAARMKLKSNNFRYNSDIPEVHAFDGFGCTGKNQSPHLSIENVPSDAKSLAITMYDPDATTGSGWWHWIVYDIEPNVTQIKAGVDLISQNARLGKNDYGNYAYGGPCPPVGSKHRYVFTVYALDVEKLELPENPSAALIGFNINAHKIKEAQISAFYGRKKQK